MGQPVAQSLCPKPGGDQNEPLTVVRKQGRKQAWKPLFVDKQTKQETERNNQENTEQAEELK